MPKGSIEIMVSDLKRQRDQLEHMRDQLEHMNDVRSREMQRYFPVLQRLEANPELWVEITEGLGIATLEGYRAALFDPFNLSKNKDCQSL